MSVRGEEAKTDLARGGKRQSRSVRLKEEEGTPENQVSATTKAVAVFEGGREKGATIRHRCQKGGCPRGESKEFREKIILR